MCVLIFCTTFPETFLILRSEQDMIKKMYIGLVRFLMKLIFSTYFRKKCSNIKFHENPSSGSGTVACGRTE
jgi:hypothetical protein